MTRRDALAPALRVLAFGGLVGAVSRLSAIAPSQPGGAAPAGDRPASGGSGPARVSSCGSVEFQTLCARRRVASLRRPPGRLPGPEVRHGAQRAARSTAPSEQQNGRSRRRSPVAASDFTESQEQIDARSRYSL